MEICPYTLAGPLNGALWPILISVSVTPTTVFCAQAAGPNSGDRPSTAKAALRNFIMTFVSRRCFEALWEGLRLGARGGGAIAGG